MIEYKIGDLFESNAEALVNTVNTDGIMGKGIALQFSKLYPENLKRYKKACTEKTIGIGKLLVTDESSLLGGRKIIINFPTKTSWRKPSEYSYIEAGLKDLVRIINDRSIKSIAIPPLGAGNGGLDWTKVKILLERYLHDVEAEIFIYEPNVTIKEALRKERVKLTPARAMLLAVLYDLVRNGEFVSEFSAEKAAYFLQRMGGQEAFNLTYHPDFYGPYSGKVRHVLHYLNGSYIIGYNAKDKKPFEELSLVADGEEDVWKFLFLPENTHYKEIVNKTKVLLTGFYSAFGLELLSTVDFLMQHHKISTESEIVKQLETWSERKKTKFANPKFIRISLDNIQQHLMQVNQI